MRQLQHNAIGGHGSGESLTTPLSHWAMYWRDATFLRFDPVRQLVGWLVRKLLSKPVVLPIGASLAQARTWRDCSKRRLETQKNNWDKLIEAAPGSLKGVSSWQRVAGNIPDQKAIRLHANLRKRRLTAVVLGRDDRGPTVYARRHFRLDKNEVVHAYLAFTEELRGNGLGVSLFKDVLPLYDELGVKRIYLKAGLSAGGAVWGKFGFRPIDNDQWSKLKPKVRKNLAKISSEASKTYESKYQRNLGEAVESILEQNDPTAFWMIHDTDDCKVLDGLAGLEYGLSAALLHGTRWSGILDLGDRRARARLHDYLNSKRR